MTHEEFRIRYYEVGPDGAVPLHTLCNYFQEAAGLDAHTLEVGAEDLAAQGVAWIITRMQLAPLAKATAGSRLTVHTWHSASDKLLSRREFRITTDKGEIVLKGTSWWLLMDLTTRRLARTPQSLLDRNPPTPEYVIAEHNPKAPDFAATRPIAKLNVLLREEDIDSNAHVNNTHFTAWAIESTPPGISQTRALKELVITFKNECFAKEQITVSVYAAPPENDIGQANGIAFWHMLRRESDGKETARVYTRWE